MSPVMGVSSEKLAEYQVRCARERVEVIRRLTDALFDYLSIDYRQTLDQGGQPQLFGPMTPTVSDLDYAMRSVEDLQSQIDAINLELDKLPKEVQPVMRASMTVPLESALRSAQSRVSEIQKQMEAAQ